MGDPLTAFSSDRMTPAPNPRRNGTAVTGVAVGDDDKPIFRPRLITRCMADVKRREMSWLWPPDKIPAGRLTVLPGNGGVGKSFLSLSIAATLSRGGPWPGTSGVRCKPGATVLLPDEDDAQDTIRARLDHIGADCGLIHIVDGAQRSEKDDPQYFSLLKDLRALEDKIEETSAALCVVDAITCYLDGVDSHKDAGVRGVLRPMAAIASRTGCAFLTVLHLNKGGSNKASHRVGLQTS